MIFDKNWRKAWKLKREEKRDEYDKDEQRLKKLKSSLDPTSEDYKKIVDALNQNNKIRKESIESRRRIPIGDKVQIFLKSLGFGALILGTTKIIKAEREGMIFTGEKKGMMDGIVKILSGLFRI